METRNECDPHLCQARLVWRLLRENAVVCETEERDLESVRERVEWTLDDFEHVLQRSLPRPEVVAGPGKHPASTESQAENPEDDPFFQKLERIASRKTFSENQSRLETGFDMKLREQLRGKIEKTAEEARLDFVLDVTGRNGGRLGTSGKQGTVRINTRTLCGILAAPDIAEAARRELTQGRWLLLTEPSCDDRKAVVEAVIVFFETIGG